MSDQGIIALITLVSTGILIIVTWFFRNIQSSVKQLNDDVNKRLEVIEAKYNSVDKNDAVLMKMLDLFQRELDEVKKNCRRCRLEREV
jgi:hypothetical protein